MGDPSTQPEDIADMIASAPSDSGYLAHVGCPKCKGSHMVTLSFLGWYVFTCRGFYISGKVEDWRARALLRKAPMQP